LGVGNFGKVGNFGNSESDILPPTPQPWTLAPVLYTKQTEDENLGEIFAEQLETDMEQVWSSEVKHWLWQRKTNLISKKEQNFGFVRKILTKTIKK